MAACPVPKLPTVERQRTARRPAPIAWVALAAARQSLDSSGLLLLGEVHGVREDPLLIRALMQALELASVALEWPGDFTSVIGAFLAGGTLDDHWLLWGGDGRITAGHLAVLAERAAAGPLELILFERGHRRGLELVPA